MATSRVTRVRTGCWTCRRRGYRCDENKPACHACTRLQIECEGYALRLNWEANKRQLTKRKGDADKRLKTAREARRKTDDDKPTAPCTDITECEAQDPKHDLPPSALVVARNAKTEGTKTLDLIPGRSSRDRFFLQHFYYTVSGLLASTDDKTINTYCCVIFPKALESDPLLDSILSISAIHLSSRFPEFEADALRMKGRAMNAVIERMKNWHGFEEDTIATIIMLSLHEGFAGNAHTWATHIVGAGCILNDYMQQRGAQKIDKSTRALFDIFAYHNVLASISRGTAPSTPAYYTSAKGWSSHPGSRSAFLASVDTLLSLVAQISLLLSSARSAGFQDLESSPSYFEIVALVHKLRSWKPPDEIPVMVRSTAEAMRHAGLLFCYRCMGSTKYSGEIQESTNKLLISVKSVPVASPTVASHMWPLYMAGCATSLSEDRKFIGQRLLDMHASRGIKSIELVRQRLEAIWGGEDVVQEEEMPVVLW